MTPQPYAPPALRPFLALVLALPDPDAPDDYDGRWHDDGGTPSGPDEDSE